MQNFLTRLIAAIHQRQQGDTGGYRGHQHGRHALKAGAPYGRAVERQPIAQHQIQRVADLKNAVARGDAC